jgi:hypothetical protein
MGLKERFINWTVDIPTPDPQLEERRAFRDSPEALSTPLTEFEERFGITETSGEGPYSSYYRPEADQQELARQRALLEEFLTQDSEE